MHAFGTYTPIYNINTLYFARITHAPPWGRARAITVWGPYSQKIRVNFNVSTFWFGKPILSSYPCVGWSEVSSTTSVGVSVAFTDEGYAPNSKAGKGDALLTGLSKSLDLPHYTAVRW